MKKETLSIAKIIILSIVLSLGISYAIAWTAPTQSPPNGNVFAPINTSSSIQSKAVGGDFCVEKVAGTKKCLSDTQLSPPVVTFTVAPLVIQDNGTATLSWPAITGVTSCEIYDPYTLATTTASISGGTKPVGPINSGQAISISASKSYTYTLTCDGVSKDAILNVLAPYSITYTNGAGGWVNIRSGVTDVTFSATGGNGGCGWAACGGGGQGAYNGGGGGAFAQTASSLILYVGGGGGGGVGAGGIGGTTASGNGAGAGGQLYWAGGSVGLPGGIGNGGNGGPGQGTSGGGGGVNNNPGGVGGTYVKNFYDDFGNILSSTNYPGGFGGSASDAKGGNSSSYGAGGGGGYGGGGGGGAADGSTAIGSGGGGGSYFASGVTPSIGTNAPSGRKWALSSIGNPSSIYLRSGPAGVGWSGSGGTAGSITMSW